jgi:hypothetical protein
MFDKQTRKISEKKIFFVLFRSMKIKFVISNIIKSKVGLKQHSPSIPLLYYVFNISLIKKKKKTNIIISPYILGKNKSLKSFLKIFYFSELNTRAVAYMTIDINRRLLIHYGYINILNTITQLNEQLPIFEMNEVRE